MSPSKVLSDQKASPILDVMLVLLVAWMLFVFKSLWPTVLVQSPTRTFACELPLVRGHVPTTWNKGITWEQVPIEMPPPEVRADIRRGGR